MLALRNVMRWEDYRGNPGRTAPPAMGPAFSRRRIQRTHRRMPSVFALAFSQATSIRDITDARVAGLKTRHPYKRPKPTGNEWARSRSNGARPLHEKTKHPPVGIPTFFTSEAKNQPVPAGSETKGQVVQSRKMRRSLLLVTRQCTRPQPTESPALNEPSQSRPRAPPAPSKGQPPHPERSL